MGNRTDRIRAALPGAADAPLETAPPSTWASDVLIPLTTNGLSGLAMGGAVAIVWYWSARGELPQMWWAVAGSAGALWAIWWTLVRYNGDEIGLFAAAYRAGRRSRDAEVNHLIMQLDTFRDAVTASTGGVTTTEAEKRIAVANATLKNARALLRIIYEHGPKHATRAEMAGRNMGQNDWERAKGLCIAAGAVDQTLQPLTGSYAAALKLVDETHGRAVGEMRKSRTFRPAWG